MAESAAGLSTIPVVTISAETMDAQQDISSSSFNSNPSSRTSSSTSLGSDSKSSLTTRMPPGEATDEVNVHEVPVRKESTPIFGGSTAPPRTVKGLVPIRSARRSSKDGKGAGSSSQLPVDDQTPWHGTVLDYGVRKQELSKVLVFPSKMVYTPSNAPYLKNKTWGFQKAIGDSDFIYSGFLFIQVGGEKERKNVADNSYVFIILEGAVEATIHQTSYAVSAGGVFLVPRDNNYSMRNISSQPAKIFFTQARKHTSEADESSVRLNKPSSKTLMLADWLLQRIVLQLIKLRAQAFDWYWRHLARYQHLFAGRRLYFVFFLLGLMVRRMPFVGSPPILNVQLIRLR